MTGIFTLHHSLLQNCYSLNGSAKDNKMPVLSALKTSNQESIEETQKHAIAKAKLEAARTERLEILGPHWELLERLKSLLPADSPDRRQLDVLYYLINITPVEQAKSAALRARWEIRRRPVVEAEMAATAAA
jgi:predicted transcriptional regulator